MRAGVISFVLGLVAVVAVASAQPAPSAVSAWIAVPAAGATAASAYVELNNPTMYDVFVVSATAEGVAATVELRAGLAPGGSPAPVTEFAIPAYGFVAAAASSPHLRLTDLTRPLAVGDTVVLILKTDGGVTLRVSAAVRTP